MPLCRTLLWSLPLAVAHKAVTLYEMQMLRSRLTPAIFISLGNALARRCNLSRGFWFHRLGICGRGSERDCCTSPNRHTQEQRPHHHFLSHSFILAAALNPFGVLGRLGPDQKHRNQQRALASIAASARARQSAACRRYSLTTARSSLSRARMRRGQVRRQASGRATGPEPRL